MIGFFDAARAEDIPRDLPGDVMPRRAWDEQSLHLSVTIDPRVRAVSGTATHVITALGAADSYVRFNAVALTIDGITVDGTPIATWRTADEWIDVPVAGASTSHTVAITWHAEPQLGLQFRGPPGDAIVEAWSQGEDTDNRYWYPSWDYPNDRFSYTADVTAPAALVAITNGRETARETLANGLVRWSYALDGTLTNYLVAVAVGDYAVYKDAGEVPFEYVAPRNLPEADVRRTLGLVKGPLAWYGEMFGVRYPWALNRQVLTQRFLYVAMENPAITTFDVGVLLDDDVDRGTFTENGVAHELAHHWFGDWLTCYGWRELWLNEGFAEYWASRWLQHRYGDEEFAASVRDWQKNALEDPYPLAPNATTIVDGRENGSVYDKGAMVLHLLATYLGDDVFLQGLRTYTHDNAERFVETSDLRRAMEDASGEHLGWLFDEYVSGGGAPTIKVTSEWTDGTLTVTLREDADGTPFTVPVDVEIGGPEVRVRRVLVGPGETKLVLDAATPPDWVIADPQCAVIAAWTQKQPTEAWIAALERSPSACARYVAAEHLGEASPDADALDALVKLGQDTKHQAPMRAAAIDALGKHGLPAIAALTAFAKDPDVRVRQAAFRGLGAAGSGEVIATAFAREGDPQVRATALRAWSTATPADALPRARKSLADVKLGRWERAAAAEIVGAHGDATDVPRLTAALADGAPKNVRDSAGDALVELVGRVDTDKARRDAVTAITPLLDDPFVWARYSAADWLGTLGDDGALPALEASEATCAIPSLRDTIRDAQALIRSGADDMQPADPTDVKRLEQRLSDVERRIDHVESWR